MQGKWNAIENADIRKMWLRTMELFLVVDMSSLKWPKNLILKNVALIMWLTILVVQFGYSALFASDENAHLSGNMFGGAGFGRLFNTATAILYCQSILYRLVLIKLTLEGHMTVMDTITVIVNERNRGLRQRKIRMTRIVLIVAIVAVVLFVLTSNFMWLGMLVLNLRSQSLLQVTCWILWWLLDVASALPVASTTIFFAAMWIMMAFNYRMDLCELMRQVENVNEADTMDEVCDWYDHVVDEAITFHRFSSLILLSLSLCTTPFFVTCLFVLNYGDNLFFSVTLFVVVVPPVLFAWFLLAIAATTTFLSENLHALLCSLAAQNMRDTRLSQRQRLRLQLMIEEVGSEETFFALRTPDGQKYTPEIFLIYLIETMLHYTLLLTFDRAMKLSAT